MHRAALGLVLVSLLAIGCDAAISASVQPQPLGSSGQAGGSPDTEPSSTVEASPLPVTTEELAALYSKAVATAAKANEKDVALWGKSSKDLDAAKARSRRRARAALTFLRTIRELPWPSDLEPIARRLVKCNTTVYVYLKHGIDGDSYKALNGRAAVDKYTRLAGRMGAKCSALANQLRLELGIGPPGLGPDYPSWAGGCSLRFIDGYLVADNGQVVLAASQGDRSGQPLVWPDGWTVRPTDDGQLEVVEDTGTVRARTGEGIVLHGVYGTGDQYGPLVVCPGQWPDNYMDPDYSPPPPPGVVETP